MAEKHRARAQSGKGIAFHKFRSRFLRSDNYSALSDSLVFPTSFRKRCAPNMDLRQGVLVGGTLIPIYRSKEVSI